MDLEGLILLFVTEISRCFLLAEKKKLREAEVLFHILIEILNKAERIYPEKLNGELKDFGLFLTPITGKKQCSGYKIRKRITEKFATFNAVAYFKKNWPKLIKELYCPNSTVLQTDGVTAFKKIYYFMKNVSEWYRTMKLQAMHFNFCCHHERHSQYSVFQYLLYVYQTFNLMSTEEKRKCALKCLLSKYPFFRIYMKSRRNKIK
jgi:hypothetical protein